MDGVRALYIGPETPFFRTVESELERQGITVDRVAATGGAIRPSRHRPVHCVIATDGPETAPIEVLKQVRTDDESLPFVLVVDSPDEAVVDRALAEGATDYAERSTVSRKPRVLSNRVANAIERYQECNERTRVRQQLQALEESSTDCIWLFDSDWEELLFISGYESVWGRPAAAIEENPRDFIEGVHPDDREFVRDAMAQLSDGSPIDIEYRIVRDGETAWVWVKGEPIRDDGGTVIRVAGFTRDITEQKREQAELNELKERYRAYVENGSDIVSVLGADGEIKYQSPSGERILGYDAETMIGENVFEYLHPDDRETVAEQFRGVVNDTERATETVDYRFRHADGSWVWLESIASNRSPEAVDGYVVNSRDITEQKQNSQRLETIIDNLPGYIYRHRNEPGWPLDFVKGSAAEITGYTAEELEAKIGNAEEIIHPEDREYVHSEVSRGLEDGGEFELTYRIVTAADEVRWIWERGKLVTDPTSEEEYLEGFITDITERKQRQKQIEILDRVLRHNVRNNVNVIQGQAEVIQRLIGDRDPDGASPIERSAQRIVEKGDDLLTTAEKERVITEVLTQEPNPRAIDLEQIVTGAVATVRAEEGCDSIAATCPGGIEVIAVPRLKQAFEELLRNAVVHAEAGDPAVRLEVATEPEAVRVTVSDAGPRLPKVEQDVLLGKIQESPLSHGSGLGLWLVCLLVRQSNGTLTYGTNDQGGNEIEIRLQLASK
jgi:PAS domain S-box-containing protein